MRTNFVFKYNGSDLLGDYASQLFTILDGKTMYDGAPHVYKINNRLYNFIRTHSTPVGKKKPLYDFWEGLDKNGMYYRGFKIEPKLK